jgi:hypothetical protein
MVARIVLACVGIVLLPCIALAQEAVSEVDKPATTKDLEAFATRIEGKMAQWQKDQDARIAWLEQQVRTLSDVHEANRQVIEQLAKRDKSGKPYLRIDASHEETRHELRRAIEESAPQTGRVIIRNTMNTDQPVAINGTTYDVLANSEREVSVPYGDFRVKVRNKPCQTRSFSFPRSEAVVTVVPEQATTTTVHTVGSAPSYWTYAW